MTTEQQILANLQALGFDNTSAAAIFGKIAQSVGVTVDSTLTELSNSEGIIFNIINTQRYGKSGYYTSKALAFQYGDSLVIDPITLDYIYAVIDATKQIVSQAAFEELVSGQLFIKIATVDAITGNLVALSQPQLAAFNNYFVNFQIPDLPVTVVSNSANVLSFTARATYYATVDLPTLQTNLINAMTTFRKSFAFNGELFTGDLQDYIKQNVTGIRDFFIYNTLIDGVPYSGSQSLAAGYFNYAVGIENNITYIPF
jgi:hypothetical protein